MIFVEEVFQQALFSYEFWRKNFV